MKTQSLNLPEGGFCATVNPRGDLDITWSVTLCWTCLNRPLVENMYSQ